MIKFHYVKTLNKVVDLGMDLWLLTPPKKRQPHIMFLFINCTASLKVMEHESDQDFDPAANAENSFCSRVCHLQNPHGEEMK